MLESSVLRALVFCFFSMAPSRAGDFYAKVVRDNGITYKAPDAVSDEALGRARLTVNTMLAKIPDVRQRMTASGFVVAIIGRNQVLSDLPEYADLRGKRTRDGRNFDTGTRGMGGERLCSVGEENLLCLAHQNYWEEDVLVHEFAHSIKSNLAPDTAARTEAAYRNALARRLYPRTAYIMRDSQEYWAETTQIWFGATVRTTVTGGINKREKLVEHDPEIAAILQTVYGEPRLVRRAGCRY